MLFNLLLLIIAGAFEAFSLFGMTPIIDLFLNQEKDQSSHITTKLATWFEYFGIVPDFKNFLFFFLSMIMLKVVVLLYGRYYGNKSKYIVVGHILSELVENLLNSKWSFVGRERKGKITSTIMREMNHVGDGFSTLIAMLTNVVRISFYLIVPFAISWKLALMSFGMGTLLFVPIKLLTRYSYNFGKEATETANEFAVRLHEALEGMKTIMSFGASRKVSNLLMDSHKKHRTAAVRLLGFSESIPVLYEPLILCLLIAIVTIARKYNMATVSEMLVIIYSLRVSLPFASNIVSDISNINRYYAGISQIIGITDQAIENVQPSGEKAFSGIATGIKFDDLVFSHEDGFSLKNISISIKKGEYVTFTGPSGCGKSTLLDILMAFRFPSGGTVRLDGVSVSELDINSYRQKIGYVPQDTVFFNMSIRENLTWPYSFVAEREIIEVLEKTNCIEFIQGAGRSLDDSMGESGSSFSGGQRQRLAIARALLGKPEILILDEVTSNLDVVNEAKIQSVLDSLKSDLTIVSVAHKISAMRDCDRIYYFENGALIENGNYEELIKLKGRFFQSYVSGDEFSVN